MMELPLLANLMPVGFEGNPSVLSPDFSSEGFNSLLLNQMIDMEGGFCNENGCQGESLFALSEESLSPRSDERESLSYNTFNELIDQTLIHPLSVPVLPEDQGPPPSLHQPSETSLFMSSPTHFPNAVGADIQGEPSLFCEGPGGLIAPFIPGHPDGPGRLASNISCSVSPNQLDPPFQGLFISQNSEGESVDYSLFQPGSEKLAPDLSLLEKGVSETVQRFVNRMGGHHEEPFSIFQIKGKDAGNYLVTGKMEDDGQRALTSLNPATVSSEKGGPDLTLKLEFIGKPQISGLSPDSENDNHRLASLKNNPSLSESYSIQNGAGPESKMKHFMPEEVPKGQNGFFSKVESFEIYHQVGRKMVWSVQNGEERIKLTLDPPRLGNLYMEVTKEKEMVRATLWAESPVTKELLEAHRTELRRILEEGGFKLEKFDVFVQQGADRFMERKEHSFSRGQQEVSELNGDGAFLSPESSDVLSIAVRRYPGMSSYIDRII
ncbi:MAG: flagellar hook-length control protein FliK [Thermodesulfobacteriota bacterium]|nr:flagellar hook-length control protein FliK [Thermodesulfobacteriota bacterium]